MISKSGDVKVVVGADAEIAELKSRVEFYKTEAEIKEKEVLRLRRIERFFNDDLVKEKREFIKQYVISMSASEVYINYDSQQIISQALEAWRLICKECDQ